MSSHVVSISSISFVCHLNVPEVFFSSNITKSSLITEVPRRYVGRCRGGGIPGIKVVGHCVCVCVYTPGGCPCVLLPCILVEWAPLWGKHMWNGFYHTCKSVPLFYTSLSSIFLVLYSYNKSAIWYWGQLCRTSAPHRSPKENNSPNTA